ncbi:MAG: hypothetical protein ACSHX5_11185 [Phycisphaerales bacterium]
MLNLRQRQFFKDHDVPCPHCSYNLRGIRKARCSECGNKLRLGTAEQLREDLDAYLMIEDVEYGMYKELSAFLSIVISVMAVMFMLTQTQIEVPTRIAISVGMLVVAGLNLLIRHRFYANKESSLAFHNRYLDRIRDAYGAITMILLILALGLIGLMTVGVFE